MADLTCAECGAATTYADAALLDRARTCGSDYDDSGELVPGSGSDHDWREV